jgi:hypothetical protein
MALLARIGREHWSVENKNHWRRDATRWRENRGVRRKLKGARDLALLRGAILALMPQEKFSSPNAAFDRYTTHRAEALRPSPKQLPSNAPSQPIALPRASSLKFEF